MRTTRFENMATLRDELSRHGLVQVLDAPVAGRGALVAFAAELSGKSGSLEEKLLHWDFGPVMEMGRKDEAENYLFSDEAVPFHWDGAFHREPRLLVFHCQESAGAGGETLFCDTTRLWDSLSDGHRMALMEMRLEFTTEKRAHYGGSIEVPAPQRHPVSGKTILRLAEEVRTTLNPVHVRVHGDAGLYRELCARLYDPAFTTAHAWRAGDLVICDNHTFLHGRRALGNNRTRAFRRVQVL